MEHPFSEAEKRWVLSEAIRTSSIPIEKLLQLLTEYSVSPSWTEMLLPHGRNVRECMDAFDAFRTSPLSSLPPNLSVPPQLQSSGASTKRKSGPENLEPSSAAPTPKRRQSGADSIGLTRSIQPKPSSNGSPQSFSPLVAGQQPKKRGRPSKADVEARNAEAIARGEVIPPPRTPGARNSQMIQFDPRSPTQRDLAPSPRILAPSAPIGGEASTGYFPTTTAGQVAAYAPMMAGDLSPLGAAMRQDDPAESEGLTASGKKKRARPGSKAVKSPKPGEGSFQTLDPHLGHIPSPTAPPAEKSPQEQASFAVRPEADQPQYPADIVQPHPPETQPPGPPPSSQRSET